MEKQSEDIIVYFTYEKNSTNPLSDLLIIKREADTSKLLFHNSFVIKRTKQLWNEDIPELLTLSKYISAEDDIFKFSPLFRDDDLIQNWPNHFSILPKNVSKLLSSFELSNDQDNSIYIFEEQKVILIPKYIDKKQEGELKNIFSYGKINKSFIDWKGKYVDFHKLIYPLYQEEKIPHIHSPKWLHFVKNNIKRNGNDIPEKTIRNAITRGNWG